MCWFKFGRVLLERRIPMIIGLRYLHYLVSQIEPEYTHTSVHKYSKNHLPTFLVNFKMER